MTRARNIALNVFAAALATAPGAAQPPAPPIEVTGAKFQSMLQRADGQYDMKDTAVVAHVVDFGCYLWELNFKPRRGEAELTEEVIVPTPASGPTTARLRLPVDLSTGKIRYRRCVGAGDPTGAYKLNLLQGERLLKSFEFMVEDPKP